ncbi:MAG: PEP-CTERM sorting domain-containing protein [Crocosphaera sp.]
MIKKLSLSTALAVATVGIGAFTQVAEAALFNFSYTSESGDIVSGMLEGEVQGDNDTVIVSAITMPMFNGSPAPDVNFIDSVSNFAEASGFPPTVSLTGTVTSMDIAACVDPDCFDGFSFDGLQTFAPGFSIYFSGASYGDANEVYNPANWSLTAKSVESVPEPSTIISLAMVGGSLLLSKRVKRG